MDETGAMPNFPSGSPRLRIRPGGPLSESGVAKAADDPVVEVRPGDTSSTLEYYHIDNQSYDFGRSLPPVTVKVADGTVIIGSRAFNYAKNIRRVELPDSVEKIHYDAFLQCNALESVKFGKGLRWIGNWAFARCSRLAGLQLPDSVEKIGIGAFRNCSSLISLVLPDRAVVGADAFMGCGRLSAVTVTAGVASIGQRAFADCPAMEFVLFEGRSIDEIKAMDNYPWGLSDISVIQPGALLSEQGRLGEDEPSVDEMSAETENCPWGIYRPEEAIRTGALLSEAAQGEAEEENPAAAQARAEIQEVMDGAWEVCEGDVTRTVREQLRELDVPEGVERIGRKAFYMCSSLERVSLPASLRTVGKQAFDACRRLQRIELPDGVESLGWGAFSGCSGLVSARLPAGLKALPHFAFMSCISLLDVEWGGVEEIGSDAFYNCSLQEIALPEGVRLVGDRAFAYNRACARISLPSTVESIGLRAFRGCDAATELDAADLAAASAKIKGGAFEECARLETARIGEGYSEVQYDAFKNCRALRQVSLPFTLRMIGASAFEGCSSLEELTVPASVDSIGPYAFKKCSSLQIVVFEGKTLDEVRKMENYPWSLGRAGSQIVAGNLLAEEDEHSRKADAKAAGALLPENGQPPEDDSEDARRAAEKLAVEAAMRGRKKVVMIDLPREVADIAELDIPEGVEELGVEVMARCTNLRRVSFPSSLKKIGPWAFDQCVELEEVELPEGLTHLAGSAFSWCLHLRRASLPKSLKTVNATTFFQCEQLQEVQLGGAEQIKDNAFNGCKSLRLIDLPGTLKYVGGEAFRRCGELEDLAVPRSVSFIGPLAFYGCHGLTAVFEDRDLDEVRTMENYPWGLSRPDKQIVAGKLLAEDAEMAGWSRMCSAIQV